MTKNLNVPEKMVDVVLDTDAYNEIDDQYAIAYMLASEKLNVRAIYAAPFYKSTTKDAGDGMEQSYEEIKKLLKLCKKEVPVFKGSTRFLENEKNFVNSPAVENLIELSENYTEEKPLYVVAIGAITNIASALAKKPEIAKKLVIIWLGGHAHHYHDTKEFNLKQDIASARIVMKSDAEFVQLPCGGVVSTFSISYAELKEYFLDKNPVMDYLARNTFREVSKYITTEKPWTRVIWDVTAVAWLLNENNRFMLTRNINVRLPGYDGLYEEKEQSKIMNYVYYVNRDDLFDDLINKLSSYNNL